MSVRVLSKVLQHSDAELAARLVLLVLADAAHDDGVSWSGQKEIAAKARVADSTVRDCLKRLEAKGQIETRKAQRGRRRVNVYRIVLPGLLDVDYDRLPFDLLEPFGPPPESGGRQADDDRRSTEPTAADPPPAPPLIETLTRQLTHQGPKTVDRVAVTEVELGLAVSVLAAWNDLARTSFVSPDWLSKVILRIRRFPDVAFEEHAGLIAYALRHPWWKGTPSPAVVYGNDGIFEKTLNDYRRNGSADSERQKRLSDLDDF